MFRVSVFSDMTAVPHLHLSDKQMLTFPVLRLRTIIVPYERFCKHACQSSPQRCRIIERSERVCIYKVDSPVEVWRNVKCGCISRVQVSEILMQAFRK